MLYPKYRSARQMYGLTYSFCQVSKLSEHTGRPLAWGLKAHFLKLVCSSISHALPFQLSTTAYTPKDVSLSSLPQLAKKMFGRWSLEDGRLQWTSKHSGLLSPASTVSSLFCHQTAHFLQTLCKGFTILVKRTRAAICQNHCSVLLQTQHIFRQSSIFNHHLLTEVVHPFTLIALHFTVKYMLCSLLRLGHCLSTFSTVIHSRL